MLQVNDAQTREDQPLRKTTDQYGEGIPASSRAPTGDDLLPPVEPPSAGFIIQLFVVPALIVLVIVGVWLMFNWLVRQAARPQDLIQGLEQGASIARWQRASELADMLRNERFVEFKRNPDNARQLAGILDREMARAGAAGGMEEGDVTLRYFIARALGEFEVNEGIDVLLEAAKTGRSPNEQLVRHGALDAIAVRAYNLRQLDPPQELEHPELEPTLFALASDEDPRVRLRVAFALGQLGTPSAIERLEVMADDPHADTRYNAAVALAHHGNDAAVETLAEMLDIAELTSLPAEAEGETDTFRRTVIVSNAIRAAEALARQNPSANLSPLLEALKALAETEAKVLAEAELPTRVASDAQRALEVLGGPRKSQL